MKLEPIQNLAVYQSAFWQLNSVCLYHHTTSLVWDPAYTPSEMNAIWADANKNIYAEKSLIFTHGDFDHIVGYPPFEGFTMIGSDLMNSRKDKEAVCSQVQAIDQEFYINRDPSVQFPVLDCIIKPVEDGLPFKLGSLDILFYKSAGHTSDGIFTIVPEFGLWVAGDYLSDIEFPFVEGDLASYYETLDRCNKILINHSIAFMVPGHGSIADNTTEIKERIDRSLRYLDSLKKDGLIQDWRASWGPSPFGHFLDKMHLKNIAHVRAQNL